MHWAKRKLGGTGYKAMHHEQDIGLNPDDPDQIQFLGVPVFRDDEEPNQPPWQYCIIFPLLKPDEKMGKDLEKMMKHEEIQQKLELIFRPCIVDNEEGEFDYLALEDTFQGDMTKAEFVEAVRWVLACLMAGHHMGFTLQADASIDGDELFLKLRLDEGKKTRADDSGYFGSLFGSSKFNSLHQIADAVNYRMQLASDKYPSDLTCPTRDLDSKRNFDGTDYIPAAIQFSKERRKFFKQFSDLDMIRLVRMRLEQFLNFDHLMSEGIVKPGGFFAIHRWRRVSMFSKSTGSVASNILEYPNGFGRLCAFQQYPGEQHLHYVKEYFGEEIGFFYGWLNFFTRYLILPAFGGLAIVIARMLPFFETDKWETYIDIAFMSLMVLWSTSFLEVYKRQQAFFIEAWGMRDWQVAEVQLSSFRQDLIGSCREELRQGFHWFGIVIVVAWTVGSNYYINSKRAHMLRNLDATFWFGYTGAVWEKVAKYLVTINITIVDSIWGFISPKLSKRENHRTPVELKDAMVLKLIFVKVFVYYYPFWYIAFVQKHIEGCNIGGTTCEAYLEQSLIVFVALHIIWVMGAALLSMWSSRRAIQAEIRFAKKQAGNNNQTDDLKYYYVEAQAKMAAYDPEAAIADYLELITSLGLVMQFSIVMPLIPLLQLFSNLVEIRFSAYKMANIFKRVEGRGSEGIGSWEKSIYGITWLALIVNVGLGVFFMKPMRDWAPENQIMTFVLVEHALILVKVLVEAFIPDVNILTSLIRITNGAVVERIFSGDKGSKVRVAGPCKVPNMCLRYDDSTAQIESKITEGGLAIDERIDVAMHIVPHIEKFKSIKQSKQEQDWKSSMGVQDCYQRRGRANKDDSESEKDVELASKPTTTMSGRFGW